MTVSAWLETRRGRRGRVRVGLFGDTGSAGMSLVELLATMALMGIFLGFGFLYLRPLETPLRDSVVLTESFLRGARSNAMATTSACRVRAIDSRSLVVETAATCSSGTWTLDNSLELTLPVGVTWTDPTWTVCFSGRGMANANVTVGLTHPERGTRQFEVLVGGMTRELP